MSLSRLATSGLVASTALLLTVTQTPAASAAAGAGSGVALGPNGRSLSVAVGIERGPDDGQGNRSVAGQCAALSTGDVAVTSLTRCALLVDGAEASNQPLALAGPAAASGGVWLSVSPGSVVQVCASARSTYLDTSSLNADHCALIALPSATAPSDKLPSAEEVSLNTLGCLVEDATGKQVLECPLIAPDRLAHPDA